MIKEVERRKIPNFFGGIDSKEEWEKNKKKILDLFLREEYGFLPKKLTPKIRIEKQGVDFAGKAEWQSIYFTFENNGKAHTVKTDLILPKGQKNIPTFVSLNFQREIPNKYLPVEEIIDTGFGIFAFCYENVTEDNSDFENGLCSLFQRDKEGDFGKISIWSYMASVCMDYLMTREEIDKNNIAVIGHSRLGKTALLTMALDERFKLACVNDSGCCGAAISRGKKEGNESIKDILRVFPYWFVQDFSKYIDNEDSLPFDQHMLLALACPRFVVIGGAKEDLWADNVGQELSCSLAKPIWKLYSKDESSRVRYYEREGTHFLSRWDWGKYMKIFKEILKDEI